jgi:plastocyanin
MLFWAGTALAGSPLRPPGHYYLPGATASETVTVSRAGTEQAEIIVVTQPVATKESGPQETLKKFGEIYAFSPQTIVVHRDEPTAITFWNLQSDDDHDFALLGADLSILMYIELPALKKTSYVFTFHREGLFDFKCIQHQPTMSGQILVLPPAKESKSGDPFSLNIRLDRSKLRVTSHLDSRSVSFRGPPAIWMFVVHHCRGSGAMTTARLSSVAL